MDYRFDVKINLTHSEMGYALLLNEMGDRMEGNLPVPDHWDRDSREYFYKHLLSKLNANALKMIHRLNSL